MLKDRLREARKKAGLTQKQAAQHLKISESAYCGYETGKRQPDAVKIAELASLFHVSGDFLLETETPGLFSPDVTEDVVTFPVIGEVAAGYEHLTYESWAGDAIEVPRSYLHGREQADFFVLRVIGDSMYPDYQDGDHVLVLRQPTMDRSGQIGVVIYGDEKGTLKRIEYVPGEDWMTLRPINPQYPPVTIRDEALEHCTVLGVAKMVIRDLEQ